MTNGSYLSVLERYRQYRGAIAELLGSIVTGMLEPRLLDSQDGQREALARIREIYPFVNLLYVLDEHGVQISEYLPESGDGISTLKDKGRGMDRSQRPYYLLAREAEGYVVTEPYLSAANRQLCLSAALGVRSESGRMGYLVLDIDLEDTISFLMGDSSRKRAEPWFRAIYGLIAVALLGVVALLLFIAGHEAIGLLALHPDETAFRYAPFSIIIFLSLSLAIFDLAKTTLEEEVLMAKDIFRHSAVRRTITRFMAAILIAVSIEALLLMFKAVLGVGDYLYESVLMMFAAVGLLVGLGVYVYLGAKAEKVLRQNSSTG